MLSFNMFHFSIFLRERIIHKERAHKRKKTLNNGVLNCHVAHNSWANNGKLQSDTVGQRSEISASPIVFQLIICQKWSDELLATIAQQTLGNNGFTLLATMHSKLLATLTRLITVEIVQNNCWRPRLNKLLTTMASENKTHQKTFQIIQFTFCIGVFYFSKGHAHLSAMLTALSQGQ